MKNAYQVSVTAEGINVPPFSEFVTVATSVAQAEKQTMAHIRKTTKERARVSSVKEVHGDFIG